MKTKNKVLLDRYDLYIKGVWKKPKNFYLLLDVAERRIGWRFDIIRLCDNWDEIVSADPKAFSEYCNPKKFQFPKKRSVPEVLIPNTYHIVKKKNNRYKVVRKKQKKSIVGRTLVVDTKRGYIRKISNKVWYHPDWVDFGCDTCADLGTCRSGGYDKSFCALAKKHGIRCGNTWMEVRE